MIALAKAKASRLEELEAVIARGVRAFVDVGNALKEICTDKLYRPENGGKHNTFEDYCRGEWGMGGARGYQLIKSADTVEDIRMSTTVDILPPVERYVRELNRIPNTDERIAVWQRVVDRAGRAVGNITEKIVREEVARFLPAKESPPFDFVAERDTIYAWLADRLEKWPEEYRNTFAKFVSGVADDLQEQLG